MLFRQLIDRETSTYTYLVADDESREAVIIDPVIDQLERDATLITELGLSLVYALDTHVHADHVTATGALRNRFGARTVLSEGAGVGVADVLVKHGDVLRFGRLALEVRETPGHTGGCLTYVLVDLPPHSLRECCALDLRRACDRAMAFTGDALLVRGTGRTDFQNGDAARLYRSIHEQLFSLPANTLLYPGHDYQGRTVTTVDEERRHNPRVGGGRSEAEFVEIMSQLRLAYPKQIDRAVPRNEQLGFDPISLERTPDRSWAPIEMSSAGIPELPVAWVRAHAHDVTVIDVREPDELVGELAPIDGARAIPLAQVQGALADTPRDQRVVLVCRSGGRSAKAALALVSLGFVHVASMRGGMTAWHRAP
jgi:sulfur dioxygenase